MTNWDDLRIFQQFISIYPLLGVSNIQECKSFVEQIYSQDDYYSYRSC